MQVSTLNAELGLLSKLVEWFQDATSLPYGHLLINLSPRTDDRLRYCTKTGSIPSKLLILDRLKQSQFLDDEQKKFSTLQVFQSFSHKWKSIFLQSCPKGFIRFLWECIVNFRKANFQSIRRYYVTNFEKEVRLLTLKGISWKQGRDVLASEKG